MQYLLNEHNDSFFVKRFPNAQQQFTSAYETMYMLRRAFMLLIVACNKIMPDYFRFVIPFFGHGLGEDANFPLTT